jgi:type I restriction enzyme, S subunit
MNQDRASTTITNSQLKEGYKQTEVGVIPEDWDLLPCAALSNLITVGIVIRPTQYYVKNGVSALRSANIREAGISDSEMVFISEKANAQLVKSQVREGDVLTVRTGYPGTSAVVTSKWAGSNCIDILITRPSNIVNSEYLTAWINSSFGKYQVIKNQGGLAQQHFNVGDLRNLLVAVPALPEQEAIACTLSDIDALIESLDRLLTKKRQIKQGAMQELLRSKDGWIERRLGDIAHIQTGSRNNQDKVEDGEYPLFVRSATVEQINTYSYDCEAILVPGEGGIGSIFHYINGRFDAHQRVYVIRQFSEEIYGKYVYLYMSKNFGFHAMQNSVKATVDSLRLPTFQNFQIFVPSTLGEQNEIANILSDMDAEIGSISAKLTKTRQIKQGMMHELLTGRIRLVDNTSIS